MLLYSVHEMTYVQPLRLPTFVSSFPEHKGFYADDFFLYLSILGTSYFCGFPGYLQSTYAPILVYMHDRPRSLQGRSQKFVFGGIKVFWGIKQFNSRSDVIFTP